MAIRLSPWLLMLLVTPALASAAESPNADSAKPKLLLVPAVYVGEVRAIYEKRIQKSLGDALASSSRLDLLTDKDRAEKPALPKDKIAPVKSTPQSRHIDEADLWRQEGTDLASDGKAKEALAKFREAIAAYEHSSSELVDFSKLADAYARAGLAAYAAGAGLAETTRLFEAGVTIQPTLVIDRRKQEKELLDAFDAAHERLENGKRFAIAVEGAGEGAEVFVDGVKIGALPSKSTPLPLGTHYVQVRGSNWAPWATAVKIKSKDMSVTAKLVEIKKEKAPRKEVELGIDAMDDCAKAGAFASDKCRIPAGKLGKQTGATYLIYCAVRPDRYGRLSLNPFIQEAASGATVALKPIDLAADLADLNARSATFEADVADSAEHFNRARALTSTPKVYGK
jgi:hypothetical protein